VNDRQRTAWGVLARSGFVDLERARQSLDELLAESSFGPDVVAEMAEQFGASADPDVALKQFTRLIHASDAAQRAMLASDESFRGRLLDVLGASEALGDFLIKDPSALDVLIDAETLAQAPSAKDARTHLLRSVGALPDAPEPIASVDRPLDALRLAYRRWLLGIAVRDLSGLAGMEAVATWLSDLADATL
jgi:[glutamine synthetase] adenylyltransferase / [glutamine synthetase]-adenylyl-L-tyrosine phosphorylase